MNEYTASQFCALVGVSPQTLAKWIARGIIPPPARHGQPPTGSGQDWRQRLFSDAHVEAARLQISKKPNIKRGKRK